MPSSYIWGMLDKEGAIWVKNDKHDAKKCGEGEEQKYAGRGRACARRQTGIYIKYEAYPSLNRTFAKNVYFTRKRKDTAPQFISVFTKNGRAPFS